MVVMRRQIEIGQKLIERKIITKEQLERALEKQIESGEKIIEILVQEKEITSESIIELYGEHIGIRGKILALKEIKTDAFNLLTEKFMKKNKVLPYGKLGTKLNVVMADPKNFHLINEIQMKTDMVIKPNYCTGALILKRIEEMSKVRSETSATQVESILDELDKTGGDEVEFQTDVKVEDIQTRLNSENAIIIRGIDAMITKAVKMKASDIHIEPYENVIRVRYRIDGILIEVKSMQKILANGLLSRVKIMANLDIAEKRIPQDGRFRIKMGGRFIDFRVSTMPTVFGEKAVMRILDRGNISLDIGRLGFDDKAKGVLDRAMKSPYGIILVTGPTGSGKSTTLYSILNKLNTPEVNISTAEDPVEYELDGINQVHCKSEIGLTFASALRSFLRQDPDIIMLGEIRDSETSEIAIKAALTGHLVLSTLHTNDAPSSIHRLLNMGIEPFMISAAILMVQAQRLVRSICPHCKEKDETSQETLKTMGYKNEYENITFYRGKGCEHCNGTGYKGRTAIYEMMEISENIRELISKKATTLEIKKQARLEGMKTLRESGMDKAIEGKTSLKEVLKVTLM